MKVFDVTILAYNEENSSCDVLYSIDKGKGVVRRSVATYSDGHLSRDDDKKGLVKEVERLLQLEKYPH